MAHQILSSLPVDILQAIFEEVAIMEKEVDLYERCSVINLESLRISHVCRLWRTVAINTPRLWVTIRLPLAKSATKLNQLWIIVTNRAKSCPLNVEIVEPPGNLNLVLRQRNFILSSWVSAPIYIEELRVSTFVGYVELFPQVISNFSSLTIQGRASRDSTRPVPIKTLITQLLSRPSCFRLSLTGVSLWTFERGAFTQKVRRLNLRYLSIQNCIVTQSDILGTLIQVCPILESCVFRNNVYQDTSPPPLTPLPRTLRLVEMDDKVNLSLLFSGQKPIVYPRLATCNIDFNYPYKEFLLANPTILTLTIPPNTVITEIAPFAPQIQNLKVHRTNDIILLCKAIESKDLCLLPHLKELHIHLRTFVALNCLKELMQPVDGFIQPQANDSSQLEKLILTWSPRACASQGIRLEHGLKPWYRWLEERGYWDRAVVRRSEEEWRFTWTRAVVSS
jgi:hypothetical protein